MFFISSIVCLRLWTKSLKNVKLTRITTLEKFNLFESDFCEKYRRGINKVLSVKLNLFLELSVWVFLGDKLLYFYDFVIADRNGLFECPELDVDRLCDVNQILDPIL